MGFLAATDLDDEITRKKKDSLAIDTHYVQTMITIHNRFLDAINDGSYSEAFHNNEQMTYQEDHMIRELGILQGLNLKTTITADGLSVVYFQSESTNNDIHMLVYAPTDSELRINIRYHDHVDNVTDLIYRKQQLILRLVEIGANMRSDQLRVIEGNKILSNDDRDTSLDGTWMGDL